jgi:hypothetical protein
MITTLRIVRVRDEEFVISVLAHIVGQGNYLRDEQDGSLWRIGSTSNDWWARVEENQLTISGRYADNATMQAVKQMLLYRCCSEVTAGNGDWTAGFMKGLEAAKDRASGGESNEHQKTGRKQD